MNYTVRKSEKIVIAMSGGIDSSVAAFLLKNAGNDCIGITLKLVKNSISDITEGKTCCSYDDILDAKKIAYKLEMPHYVLNFTEVFEKKVIQDFINKYTEGLTPNPCIECNRIIKFHELLHRVQQIGYTYLATGHYARIIYNERTGRYNLLKATDILKDQSYFLYMMTQEQLQYTLFPLGNMSKKEVRALANDNRLHNYKKPDSQDICFIKDNNYAEFIETHASLIPEYGNFVYTDGKKIGTHKGIHRYTIGQRKGLEVCSGRRLYVCSKDILNNTIVLGQEKDLLKKSFDITNINLISTDTIKIPMHLSVKTRYSHTAESATVIQTDTDVISICFDEPQKFICPGQSAVLYDGDSVVGGGIIR